MVVVGARELVVVMVLKWWSGRKQSPQRQHVTAQRHNNEQDELSSAKRCLHNGFRLASCSLSDYALCISSSVVF